MNAHSRQGLSYPIRNLSDRHLQDDTVARWMPYLSAIAYAFVSSVFVYSLLVYLTILPSFNLSRLAWKLTVMLSPGPIVFALDKNPNEGGVSKDNNLARDIPMKEQALRRILRFDRTSFLSGPSGYPKTGSIHLRTTRLAPAGLGNFNNSCYQNSIIQGLASLRQLDYFLKNNLQTLGHVQQMSTHVSLKETIAQLNTLSNAGRKLWLPNELKSMSSWQQQDAQEYYSKLVEQIDKEISEASKSLVTDDGFKLSLTALQRNPCSSPDENRVCEILKRIGFVDLVGPFDNPLEGLMAQRVGCMTCGYCEGLSLIPFTCLTVPLAQHIEYDVRDCLDDYTALEPIEGVECIKCTVLRVKAGLLEFLDKLRSNDWSQLEPSEKAQKEALSQMTESRLNAVQDVLQNEDFSEKALSEHCRLNPRNRVSSTKSRQSVIARAPKSLAIHINRSVFDELTGVLRKNYAKVIFPDILDLDEWCLGSKQIGTTDDTLTENWEADPTKSMLSSPSAAFQSLNRKYELRAVITHYGRHDDGHYICYRKFSTELPTDSVSADNRQSKMEGEEEQWFELSDADVTSVSKNIVMEQGGAFMLFYELIGNASEKPIDVPSDPSSQNFTEGSCESPVDGPD
ncbi:hypothetical protein D8B26_007619 [Coccidioides posadasii str. Silveira]|uniref:ubiquitinyl hydrolase 1 n=1 Tax=Coccidioides posadasii (strain RMSCC 757 / Silveira) TaxID=443226 RepID=E9D2H1_COCPS|nr:conserved hypothetical protein [Coccidioides posadasii str. Silveira]QVM13002.1 hypothetical protein D8B26_007619 [Coccidioides posadasii str. Silveira]